MSVKFLGELSATAMNGEFPLHLGTSNTRILFVCYIFTAYCIKS